MRSWDLSRILIKPNQHIAASCDTCYFYLPLYADLARLQTSGENQKRRKKMSTNHTHKSRSPQNKNWKNRTNTSKLVLQQFFLHFQHFPQHHERPTRKEKAKVEKHVRERFILEFTCAPLSCAAFFSSSPHGLKLDIPMWHEFGFRQSVWLISVFAKEKSQPECLFFLAAKRFSFRWPRIVKCRRVQCKVKHILGFPNLVHAIRRLAEEKDLRCAKNFQ